MSKSLCFWSTHGLLMIFIEDSKAFSYFFIDHLNLQMLILPNPIEGGKKQLLPYYLTGGLCTTQ